MEGAEAMGRKALGRTVRMTARAARSEWESEVLGVRVGVISSEKIPTTDLIRSENRGAFDVVFVYCSKWAEQCKGRVAIDHLYDMEAITHGCASAVSCISTIKFPSKKHLEIIRNGSIENRFSRDPNLFKMANERYVRWLSEHEAYVLSDDPESAFLIPTTDEDGHRRISLIAVDRNKRGAGIGTRLVSGSFAAEPGCKLWRVKVSARNRKALKFYETIGFRVKSVSTVFHVWV
jgi:ribosomal protein S18 acetylase RimI-like enzyme